MPNKVVCLVGMCGSGKSETADYLRKKTGFGYIRFGQIVMDRIDELGLPVTEAVEKQVREDLRKEHGMAAFALLNIPKIDEHLKKGSVIADGLYSWEEYLILKEKYKNRLSVVAIYASPETRYARLEDRSQNHKNDKEKNFRSLSREQALSRDKAEIENINKAGPIAMADHTIINESSIAELHRQLDKISKNILR